MRVVMNFRIFRSKIKSINNMTEEHEEKLGSYDDASSNSHRAAPRNEVLLAERI